MTPEDAPPRSFNCPKLDCGAYFAIEKDVPPVEKPTCIECGTPFSASAVWYCEPEASMTRQSARSELGSALARINAADFIGSSQKSPGRSQTSSAMSGPLQGVSKEYIQKLLVGRRK
jgi:hypothetical protein